MAPEIDLQSLRNPLRHRVPGQQRIAHGRDIVDSQDVHSLHRRGNCHADRPVEPLVDRAIQVHGGLGLMKELPLEWWYRQIRSTRITEGANEVLRWRLAQNIIRGHH